MLLELVEKPRVRPVPRTGLLGIYHFALLLPSRPELGRFVRSLVRRGVRFGAADHAFSEALYLEDPDGITLEVYRDRPGEEWPRAGGKPGNGLRYGGDDDADSGSRSGLPLVSDPLDAAGIVASAGDVEWDGVPPGAVVGHMHFFVDDLDAARNFYVRGLGFEPTITVPTALFVSAAGYHHHVGLNTWRAGAPVATDDHAKLLDWELVVPDVSARRGIVDRLREAGFPGDPAPGERPESAGRQARAQGRDDDASVSGFVARDPWGLTVRIRG